MYECKSCGKLSDNKKDFIIIEGTTFGIDVYYVLCLNCEKERQRAKEDKLLEIEENKEQKRIDKLEEL